MEWTNKYTDLEDYIRYGNHSLEGYLRFSTIPVVLEYDLLTYLCSSNELVLKAISALYEKNIYPHLEENFVNSIKEMDDPPESIILVRLDYMRNSENRYVCFDLNTQPGTPGSMVWSTCDFREGEGVISLNRSEYFYFNVFPALGRYYRKYSNGLPRVAIYENDGTSLNIRLQNMLQKMCEIIRGFNFFRYDFIRDRHDLSGYEIIEPFFNINGSLSVVYYNYNKALESNKPLGSNLKLVPYESKDFAFLELLDGVIASNELEKVKNCLVQNGEKNHVEKCLFGMSGSCIKKNLNMNWSDRIVTQELLEPGLIDACVNEEKMRLIYEIGVTSLMYFKGRHLVTLEPCVDLTVKASDKHPISGPDTIVIPALVAK